jgi:hypothetical protein
MWTGTARSAGPSMSNVAEPAQLARPSTLEARRLNRAM